MSRFQVAGFAALLVVAALAGGTVIGSVAASTSPRVAAPDTAAVPAAASPAAAPSEVCAAFRRAFAANLGVDESALTPAAKAASIATVDAAVAVGQADQGRGRPAQGTDRESGR